MKFNVQSQKTNDVFVVEIPESVHLKMLTSGEKFCISLSEDGGKNFKKHEACFIANGQALLIGKLVLRFSKKIVKLNPENFRVSLGKNNEQKHISLKTIKPFEPKKSLSQNAGGALKSPMSGKILAINVQENSSVKVGDTLIIIEAMKMENKIISEWDGTVKNIKAVVGSNVTANELLLTIKSEVK